MTRHPVTRLFAFVLALMLAWGGLGNAQAAEATAGADPSWSTLTATHAAAHAPLDFPGEAPATPDEPSVVVADPSADLSAVLPEPTGLRHTLVAATAPRPGDGPARRPPFLDNPQRPPSA